jgi:hypothetical protein
MAFIPLLPQFIAEHAQSALATISSLYSAVSLLWHEIALTIAERPRYAPDAYHVLANVRFAPKAVAHECPLNRDLISRPRDLV